METAVDLYLRLLKKCLVNSIYPDLEAAVANYQRSMSGMPDPADVGAQWPAVAHTMLSEARLENIRWCLESVVERGVRGDFIETGVWRGGGCIFARGILRALNVDDRVVWVADSFMGVPPPDPSKYPLDKGIPLHLYPQLAVSQADVAANFAKYDLLDDQVKFIEGWFSESLPNAPIEALSVLRIDGDLYESTMDALSALFHKVSVSGFVIIDDYRVIDACKQAVHDFRDRNGIQDQIMVVDECAVYWQKSG